MPELPEVETIRRGLANFCLGQKIRRAKVFCDKSFIGPTEIVEGAEIVEFRRFGKALVVDLSNGVSMMIHLRMTGQLIYRVGSANPENSQLREPSLDPSSRVSSLWVAPREAQTLEVANFSGFAGGHPSDNFVDELPNKQTRVMFELSNGTLYFNDQRKFGFVKVLPTEEVEQDKFIAALAPEPWKIDAGEFYKRLQRHKNSPIKAVILDQKVICGLGNIYADEALYDSKIHPETRAGNLTRKQAEGLIKSACKVMEASINSGGSTMATYVKADGTKGDYLEKFAQVFRREGQPCGRCGTEIVKLRVAGRGTHICPKCQERK